MCLVLCRSFVQVVELFGLLFSVAHSSRLPIHLHNISCLPGFLRDTSCPCKPYLIALLRSKAGVGVAGSVDLLRTCTWLLGGVLWGLVVVARCQEKKLKLSLVVVWFFKPVANSLCEDITISATSA